MHVYTRAAGLLALLMLGACGGSDGGADGAAGGAGDFSAIPYAPTPDADPFYAQPQPFPDAPPGTIVKFREVTFAPAGIAQPNPAWLIQYITHDVNDRPLAATAVVVKPLVPSLLAEPPLVAYQFAYDSLGAQCAPTRTVTGDRSNANSMLETLVYVSGLTAQGWTMVFPDYEGPYHAYGAGKLSGQATLDAIRAALSFEPLGLHAESPVAMWGYSGGALATSWAASLQGSYAPELNIVGVASGGTPADVFGVVQNAENGPFIGLIFSAVVGAARAYPQLIPPAILNDEGRRVIEAIKDGCIGATTDGSPGASGALADYVTIDDPYNSPGALAVKPLVTLPQADHTPVTNMYLYHEILDELIPIEGTDALVESWCASGATVTYQRSLSGEHIAGVAAGAPLALAYLVGRLNGLPVDVVPPTAQRCN